MALPLTRHAAPGPMVRTARGRTVLSRVSPVCAGVRLSRQHRRLQSWTGRAPLKTRSGFSFQMSRRMPKRKNVLITMFSRSAQRHADKLGRHAHTPCNIELGAFCKRRKQNRDCLTRRIAAWPDTLGQTRDPKRKITAYPDSRYLFARQEPPRVLCQAASPDPRWTAAACRAYLAS